MVKLSDTVLPEMITENIPNLKKKKSVAFQGDEIVLLLANKVISVTK